MWTAKIAEKELRDGQLLVNVAFSNGTQDFNEIISVRSQEELSQRVKSRILELERVDLAKDAISVGNFTPVDKTQSEKEVFYEALENLRRIKRAIDLGVIDETHPKFKDAVQEVKTLFKPEFLSLF